MSTITWETVQELAVELGCSVSRKKKFLSSAKQVVVISPVEKEWHSGYHKKDRDLELTCAYLTSVKQWQQRREQTKAEMESRLTGNSAARHANPRRFHRERDDARHNPNVDTASMAMLQAQLAACDNRPASHSPKTRDTHHDDTPTHSTPSSDYDSPSSGSSSSDSSSPSGD